MALSDYIGDTFNRTNEESWGDAETGDDTNKTWAPATGSVASVAPTEAVLSGSNAFELSVVGDDHDDITEATMYAALLMPDTAAPGQGVILRSTGSADSGYVIAFSTIDGKINCYKNGVASISASFTLTEGGLYLKARVEEVEGLTTISYKAWSDLDSEPGSWTVLLYDETVPILTGKAGLVGTTISLFTSFTLQGETVPDPEPDPGLPGGAVDESRREPLEPGYSLTSLKGNFARGPKPPPPRPVPADVMRIFKSLGRR